MSRSLNHPKSTSSESENLSVQIVFYNNLLKENPLIDPLLFLFVQRYWTLPGEYQKSTKIMREYILDSIPINQAELEDFFGKLWSAGIYDCGPNFVYYLEEWRNFEQNNQGKHELSKAVWGLTEEYIQGIRELVPSIKRQLRKIRDEKNIIFSNERPKVRPYIPDVSDTISAALHGK